MGVVALGLDLSKEDSFLPLTGVREGSMPIQEFHKKMRGLISSQNIPVLEANINRPF